MAEPLRDDKPLNLDDSVCFDELGRIADCGSVRIEPKRADPVSGINPPQLTRRCASSDRELLRYSFREIR